MPIKSKLMLVVGLTSMVYMATAFAEPPPSDSAEQAIGQTVGMDSPAVNDPVDTHSQAYKDWTEVMAHIAPPGTGCFHATYPSITLQRMACHTAPPHPMHSLPPQLLSKFPALIGSHDNVGDTYDDYILQAPQPKDKKTPPGLIREAIGSFPSETGVTSESSQGGEDAIDGPNEYTLQLNTNQQDSSAGACHGQRYYCQVWQQFLYGTDYVKPGQASLYMQYWILFHPRPCPAGWQTFNDHSEHPDWGVDCMKNSPLASLPDFPPTQLNKIQLTGNVVKGGDSRVTLLFNGNYYAIEDSNHKEIDIASVWTQAEFNVFGDAQSAQAVFNKGASLTVRLNADYTYAPQSAPTCIKSSSTTAETNNFNLGKCIAVGSIGKNHFHDPYIQFTESN